MAIYPALGTVCLFSTAGSSHPDPMPAQHPLPLPKLPDTIMSQAPQTLGTMRLHIFPRICRYETVSLEHIKTPRPDLGTNACWWCAEPVHSRVLAELAAFYPIHQATQSIARLRRCYCLYLCCFIAQPYGHARCSLAIVVMRRPVLRCCTDVGPSSVTREPEPHSFHSLLAER